MLLAALALAATQAAAPPPMPEDDVVVVAQRLRALRYTITLRRGRLVRWTVERSTGDPRLDRIVERTARRCAREAGATPASVFACVERDKPAIVAKAAALWPAPIPPAPRPAP